LYCLISIAEKIEFFVDSVLHGNTFTCERIFFESIFRNGKSKKEWFYEFRWSNAPHKSYDYTTVEERFPVRWCAQSGGHIWDHKDPGQRQSWVPQATWEFFEKF
jgi:hypothetical protein